MHESSASVKATGRTQALRCLGGALLLAVAAGTVGAQSLAERVAAVGTGTVRLEFASKPGVCGNGRGNISVRVDGVRTISSGTYVSSGRRDEWEDDCEPGPVRIALDVERREVTGVRSYVGGRWRGSAERDLGTVSSSEASAFLLQLAASGRSMAAKEAVFPATLADAPNPWRDLLRIAKDDTRPRDVRNSATFWVAHAAEREAVKGLEQIVEDEGDREVRKSAVFAISRRPADESVPSLIRVARTHRDPEIRKSAIFWLGQSKDSRALRYFEEVLLGER
jgi:hypothetical protein